MAATPVDLSGFNPIAVHEHSYNRSAGGIRGKGVYYAREQGKEAALAEFNNPNGRFVEGELYLFAYDLKGTTLALPFQPELVSTNRWALNVTIREVGVHRSNASEPINEAAATETEDTSASGWTVVVDQTQTVDLIPLTDVSQVLGRKTVEAGKYTQIRLAIESGTIMVDGTEYDLTVPSGVLKLNRGFSLEPDQTRTLTLDFNVERSIVQTGACQYKLTPVIAVLSD